jgi:hypothetical protein
MKCNSQLTKFLIFLEGTWYPRSLRIYAGETSRVPVMKSESGVDVDSGVLSQGQIGPCLYAATDHHFLSCA